MNEQLPRELTDSEISFLEELELYNKVLCFTADISIYQGGIDSDGRGVRGMKIFTRQTLIAFSLSRIFPKPKKKQLLTIQNYGMFYQLLHLHEI